MSTRRAAAALLPLYLRATQVRSGGARDRKSKLALASAPSPEVWRRVSGGRFFMQIAPHNGNGDANTETRARTIWRVKLPEKYSLPLG